MREQDQEAVRAKFEDLTIHGPCDLYLAVVRNADDEIMEEFVSAQAACEWVGRCETDADRYAIDAVGYTRGMPPGAQTGLPPDDHRLYPPVEATTMGDDAERAAYEAARGAAGPFTYADEAEVMAAALRFARVRLADETVVSSDAAAARYMKHHFAGHTEESVVALWLSTRHQVVAVETLALGTIDATKVYSRRVLRAALAHNAAAVILGHNHPSGDPEPSGGDSRLTHELKGLLDKVDVRLLDHVVVAGDRHVSFAGRGMI